MIRYLIKNAIRNIIKQFRFSIINAVGLVIGIITFIVIISWVKYELSFDNFNADSDLIYRVTTTTGAQTPNPMAASILEEVPEVESAVRYQITSKLTFKVDDKMFYENNMAMADPELFQMFNFPFVVSNAEHAMSQPFNIVLTQRMAEKYFGKEDPLGKTILVEGQLPAKVTGIIKNLPANSHIQFDCVVPYSVMKKLGFDLDNWYNWNPDTYIKLRQNKNVDAVRAKIQALADKYRNNNTEKFVLQPLKEIHFNTNLDFDHAITINPGYIYILSGGAFLILIISIINYINLSVALYKKRLKEVGVKRTLGATKANLVKQIFVETAILVSVSFIIALLIIYMIKPVYLKFLGESASFDFFTPVSVIG
ncbi:MAG TPA: ABC transporter permease, partial [Draconibacterium sp.]|nr:ABC transporter permease [Draconibacterium sp.]